MAPDAGWDAHMLDSSVVRAHAHAAGAPKAAGEQALGRSRGGFSTKLHLRADAHGRPVALHLTGGESRPGLVERVDHVSVRNGVASLFLACEPLLGWRHAAVADHCRRVDWAHFIRSLLEGRYREAEKLVLIMDPLNTHSPASLSEAFPPEEAKRLADRIEIHHTPKHGSWLNMAEIELSALGRQCLSRRIARQDTLKRQIAAWEDRRNACTTRVQWQFTTQEARIKLRSLYPSLQP
jgi:hypothetical protein